MHTLFKGGGNVPTVVLEEEFHASLVHGYYWLEEETDKHSRKGGWLSGG